MRKQNVDVLGQRRQENVIVQDGNAESVGCSLYETLLHIEFKHLLNEIPLESPPIPVAIDMAKKVI